MLTDHGVSRRSTDGQYFSASRNHLDVARRDRCRPRSLFELPASPQRHSRFTGAVRMSETEKHLAVAGLDVIFPHDEAHANAGLLAA